MLATNQTVVPAEFRPEPDLTESYSRVVEACAPAVRSAAKHLDLVGPLVESLIAIGVDDHIATPCGNGLVWRFGGAESGRLRIAWDVSVAAETDDTSLVTLALHATASDDAARERLFEAWPAIGPVVEAHAMRVLHRIEALAEEAAEDPFEDDAPPATRLQAVS